MSSKRRKDRLVLGEAAILSLNQAVELLPLGDPAARAWLTANDLVRDISGRKIVRWRDVLEALAADNPAQRPKQRSGRPRPRVLLVDTRGRQQAPQAIARDEH
jgi:hypothetical protein